MRIQTGFVIGTLSIVIVTLLLIFVLAINETQRALEGEFSRQGSNSLLYSQELINHFLHDMSETTLVGIANDPQSASILESQAPPNSLTANLDILINTQENFEGIELFDNNCVLRASDSSLFGFIGDDFSERDYCIGMKSTGATYYSEAFISVASQRPVIAVAVPIKAASEAASGQQLGFVVGIIDLSAMREQFSNIHEDSDLILLDKHGREFINTKGELSEISEPAPGTPAYEVLNLISQGETDGFFEFSGDSGGIFVAFKKTETLTMILIYQSNLFVQPIQVITQLFFWISLISIPLLFFSIWFVARSISAPLDDLTRKVDDITRGNLDIQLPKTNITEVQNLTESMNRILASMKLAILRANVTKEELGLGAAIRAKDEAERKFKTIFEVVPSAIFTLNNNRKITSWNLQAEEITGYKEGDVVGKLFEDIPIFEVESDCDIFADEDKKPVVNKQCKIKRKDGQIRNISANIDVLHDSEGNISGNIISFEDITLQTLAEQEMEKSEKRYRTLFNSTRDVIIVADLKGKVVDVNEAITAYGFTREGFIGTNYLSLVPMKHHPKLLANLVQLARGKTTEGTIEIKTPNGIVFAEFKTTPIQIDENKKGLLTVLRDVTNKERGKFEIAKAHDIARRYFDLSGMIMVAIDKDRKVMDINDKGAELLGYPKEEIIGKNWFDNFLPKKYRKEIKAIFQHNVKDELVEYHENSIVTKAGEERLISWHNTKLTNEQGDVIGTLSSGEDITDKKEVEDRLKSVNNLYKTLVEQSSDAIVVLTGPPPKMMYTNDAMSKFLGYSKEELLSMSPKKVSELVDSKDRKKALSNMQKRLQGKKAPETYTIRLRSRTGNASLFNVSSKHIKFKGVDAVQVIFSKLEDKQEADKK